MTTKQTHKLAGLGPRIVEMIEQQGLTLTQVAAALGATENGIRYRYRKEKSAEGPTTQPRSDTRSPLGDARSLPDATA